MTSVFCGTDSENGSYCSLAHRVIASARLFNAISKIKLNVNFDRLGTLKIIAGWHAGTDFA